MKTRLLLILLLAIPLLLRAEVITLRNGKTVSGTLLVNDDDVVIVRDASGARFQFPKSDVLSIVSDEEAALEDSDAVRDKKAASTSSSSKKTAIRVELAGGLGTLPHESVGGSASASVIIGSRRLAGRELTLGGQVGYQGYFLPATGLGPKAAYHFLPIALALRMPFFEGKHAPEFGASLGYGAGLSKSYRGGVYVGGDLGYRYLNPSGQRFYVGAYTHFQQATVTGSEQIESTVYSALRPAALVSAGVKVAISL